MGTSPPKSAIAFRTIGEVSAEFGIPQHILRYWETRFPQLRPLQRAGNRRYYRPADVDLVRRIDRLLNHEGYTIKGVRKLLDGGAGQPPSPDLGATPAAAGAPAPKGELRRIRDRLAAALAQDGDTAA
ncbi:MerR family transcriptional regulator [Sphingomonas sp.]|uniref:MerR family transcriptional regulator n=1 Tax=Sphingomonas sp. TaxID=28214 RepID=UPI003B3BB354